MEVADLEASDEALVDRMRVGDEAAFTILVERYHPRLTRLAATFVGGRDLVEDVAQETWVAVLRGVDKFEGRSTFKAWLFQICVNRARTTATREHRIVPVDDVSWVSDRPVFTEGGGWATAPESWPEGASDREDLAKAAQAAILHLPWSQRQVITLRDVEGLSAEEVCDMLELSAINQRVLLHRARLRVRCVLAEAMRP